MFASPNPIRRDVAQILRPPRRMRVSDAAQRYVRIGKGTTATPWSADTTPYMIEPMDCLNDRRYHSVCFVGPARTGKTVSLVDCWIGYVVKCDPGDMMVVNSSQDQTRDYSRRRADRLFRHSPELGAELASGTHADNTYDKTMRTGIIVSFNWPTVSQLSAKDARYVAFPDYDRGNEKVGGEGIKYLLGQKRTETFMSAGKTMLESSPGYDWSNRKWKRSSPHELPPSPGIVSIYNQGDRRWRYWSCLECKCWFSPQYDLLICADDPDINKAAESVRLGCPHCGSLFEHRHKREFSRNGIWLREGRSIDENRAIAGTPRQSGIASFHVSGVEAAYQTWESLTRKRLLAEREYEATGNEEPLRSTVLIDEGVPYKRRQIQESREAGEIQQRAEVWEKRTVPDGVRFILIAVDIQKTRFVVQAIGYGTGKERWLIDRYNIARSQRRDEFAQQLHVDPAAYAEDWQLLKPLIGKRYPLSDGSGRYMSSHLVGCDSGGSEGVTPKAYDFWRGLTGSEKRRFWLVKGTGLATAPRVDIRRPDTSKRKDRTSGSRGDIPVLFLNANMLKDDLYGDLGRKDTGPRFFHVPTWIGGWWYQELTREERDEKKGWLPKSGNEAWDLAVYCDALAIHAGIERINWATPPAWAADWDHNTAVSNPQSPNSSAAKTVIDMLGDI